MVTVDASAMMHSRYYSPNEVAVHNTVDDLWVSYLGRVYDLTPLAQEFQGDVLLKPIIEAAGQDISHWFDEEREDMLKYSVWMPRKPKLWLYFRIYDRKKNIAKKVKRSMSQLRYYTVLGEIRIEIDQLTNCRKYHTPRGRFIHIPPPMPQSNWFNNFGTPWWKDPKYEIGILSEKTRCIRIINTLTAQEQVLEVCSEETINEILERYLMYNAHAASYTWKYDGVQLDMDKTLEENGIVDEDEMFYELQMEPDNYRQPILLYFNDDLTEL